MDLNKIFKESSTEDLQKLISLLQTMVDEDSDTKDNNEEPESSPMKTRSRKAAESSSRKTNKNKFLSMQEMNMHKEDTELQKKLSKHRPVPRNRGFEPLSVKCRVCGKSDKVNPALADSVDRYKCNACASSAG